MTDKKKKYKSKTERDAETSEKYQGFSGAARALAGGFGDLYTGTKRDVKKGIKNFVKDNFPPGAKFSKAVKKWDKGGKINHYRGNRQHD